MIRHLLAPLALGGCAFISESHHADRLDLDGDGVPWPTDCDPEDGTVSVDCDGPDTDVVPDPPEVTEVTPPFGSTAGGGVVHVYGGPFDGSAVVQLLQDGVLYQADVIAVSEDALQIEVPAVDAAGLYDVAVETDDGAASLTGAFEYYADQSAYVGLVGQLTAIDYLGDYWEHPVGEVRAHLLFPSPADHTWRALFTGVPEGRNCIADPPGQAELWSGLSLRAQDASSATLSFEQGGDVVLLRDEGTGAFVYTEAVDGGGDWSGDVGLAPIVTADFPAAAIESVAETPARVNIEYPNLNGTTQPTFTPGDTLQWSRTNQIAGDWMVLEMVLYQYTGGPALNRVRCVFSEDDGRFTPPNSQVEYWPDWQEGMEVGIALGRVELVESRFVHDHARTEVATVYYVVGEAITGPMPLQ